MSPPPGKGWNEENLSESPAVRQLAALGYSFVAAETLEAERESLKDVVLTKRLAKAVKRLNPWISEDNVAKAVRAVTHVAATSLIEASEKLYTILTYGTSLEQDRGDGKKGQTVRFLDFDKPERNEFLVSAIRPSSSSIERTRRRSSRPAVRLSPSRGSVSRARWAGTPRSWSSPRRSRGGTSRADRPRGATTSSSSKRRPPRRTPASRACSATSRNAARARKRP